MYKNQLSNLLKKICAKKTRSCEKLWKLINFRIDYTNRMPHIISQTQDESYNKLKDKQCPVQEAYPVEKAHFRYEWNNRSSLVTVRSHLRTMPCSKKKNKKLSPANHLSNIKKTRCMDVASFREISRIQRLENETLKALKASSRNESQTKEIWSGFWSRAAKMESKKKRKPLGIIQSRKRRTNKKKKTQEAQPIEKVDDIPIARLLDISNSNP